MEYKNILVTFEGEIGILTINRPKALNALNIETLQEIQMGIQEVKDHPEVKVLIVTGSGEKAFVALRIADDPSRHDSGNLDQNDFQPVLHLQNQSILLIEEGGFFHMGHQKLPPVIASLKN